MFAALSVLAATNSNNDSWTTFLAIAAIVLVIAGIVKMVQRDFLLGVTLIVIACLIGPGGISLLS